MKIFIEDGFGASSDWPMMSKETLARIRAETRKHKLLLIAHANALDMQRIALDAGVDVLAHGLWNWNEYDGQQGMPAPIAEHLRNVHAKGIGYQPTLRVLPGTADLFRADTLKDPMYAKVVPPAVLAWYATEPGQWFKQIMREGATAPPTRRSRMAGSSRMSRACARCATCTSSAIRCSSAATRRPRRRTAVSPATTRIARCV